MTEYDGSTKSIKALQTRHLAELQTQLAKAQPDRLQSWRTLFLVSLIKAREAQKLSQSQLAVRLGTKQSAISRIESGRGNPSLNTLLTIARALEVSLVLE
jgi:ribosome-binding protein aMBF1 (putative translation factor)